MSARALRIMIGHRPFASFVAASLAALAMLATSGQAQEAGGIPEPIPGQSVTKLQDGRLLLLGGLGVDGPIGTAEIIDPNSGIAQSLPAIVPRAWHTATVLPDGTVFVFGGLDARSRVLAAPEIVSPTEQVVEALLASPSTPRVGHSATLLTDGRVLLAGGTDETGRSLTDAVLWSPQTGDVQSIPMTMVRTWHAAVLEPDGTALLWGGVDNAGIPLISGDRFDPTRGVFTTVYPFVSPTAGTRPARLEASIPAAGATDVPVDSVIALRFSIALRVETVKPDTVTLTGPDGVEPAQVVAAEQGLLVFVTPVATLKPGALYTVSVMGAEGSDGMPMPATQVKFTTAGASVSETPLAPTRPDDTLHTHRPARAPAAPGTASELDATEWTGERRNGQPHSRWQELPPLQAPGGVTALAGQVLRLNGEPLADVTLEIGGHSTRTDLTGRFLLASLDPGPQEFVMDGSTANTPTRTYATFSYTAQIAPNQTTVLPFTIWMPLLDMQHALPLPRPTPADLVARSPLIPGLEVHVPRNVILRTHKGPLTEISVTQIPVDRPPFPVPPGTTFLFTPQGHGARVERPDGSLNDTGVRLVFPNVDQRPPGSRVDLWYYDYGRWQVYGQGTVTPDGQQIVPDPGVEFHDFTCAFVLGPVLNAVGPILDGAQDGEPVDLATGLFTHTKTDLVLPDVIPIIIKREYWQMWAYPGTFGFSQNFLYQMFLTGDASTFSFVELVLANGAKLRFPRITGGTDKVSGVFEHTASPTAFYKARITWNAPRNGWDLSMRDGLVYQFAPAGNPGPLPVGIRDRAGNQLTITRTTVNHGREITRILSPSGRWVDVTWNTGNRISQIRDNLGRTVAYTYDASGRLSQLTDAGGTTAYTYDGISDRIKTITDARGIAYLTNDYDANARVIKQTQADGTFYQFAYTVDGTGKVTQADVTDPRGNVRRVTFNSAGYPLTDTRAFGTALAQTTTYVRDTSSSLVTSMTDALGRRTDYTYDAQGNVLTVTRLAGTADAVTTTFTYEPTFNQLTSVTDPLSHTTSFGHDGVGNLTTVTDALNHQSTLTYNAAGQPLTITTPAGTTQLAYDQGDLATITDATGKTTTRFTDGGGRLISLTDPRGLRTRYDYDTLNRLVKITNPLGGPTQFGYDGNGNLLSLTDARGSVTSYTYDTMDRLATRTDPLLRQESYVRDSQGNLVLVTDRKSQVTQTTFDALDRPTQVLFQDGSTTSYTWDASNRLTQVVDSLSGTTTRAYDGLDRLVQETTPQGMVSYGYDAAGRRTSMTASGQAAVTCTYDAADRLTQITQGSATVTFSYDDANRRTSLTLPNGLVTESSYDAASRLTGLTYKNGSTILGTLTYGYDAAGNRTVMGGTWAATGLPQPVVSATYDAANQQLTFGSQTLTYDANGSLTGDGVNTYTWDARNRLVAINGASLTASFGYDALGRRWSKAINGTSTQFLYDGLNPVQEQDAGTAVNLLTGLAIDEYLTRTDDAGTRAFLTDALGSTLALADDTGAVQTQYTYEPFGATTAAGAADANPFQYIGRENDGTGLYYYRARYYQPGLQRFISEDPIGFAGGDVNLYRYVWDSPTNYIDPLGYGIFSGVINSGVDWVASKALKFPKFPVLVFIPVTALEVVAKGPCVIPKRLVQAGAAYLGSWAGSVAGAELGFAIGELVVPTGGGLPGAFVGWTVGGAAGSGAAALGAGFLYDAVVPGGDCTVPPASGSTSRSKSSS